MSGNFFEIKGSKVQASPDICRRLVKLHTVNRKPTQGVVATAIGVNEPDLSKFMRGYLKDEHTQRIAEKLYKYFSDPKLSYLLDELHSVNSNLNALQRKILQSMARTRKLAPDVIRFLGASNSYNAKMLSDGISSFYYCYKYSQRFSDSASGRQIVKSIVRIKYDPDADTFLFEDRQFNLQKIKERDITHGVAIFNGNGLFLIGREIDENQPRLFWLNPGTKSYAANDEEEAIQHMTGFCFEGYAKFGNPHGLRPGSFFSPIGISRISNLEINNLGNNSSVSLPDASVRSPAASVNDEYAWEILTDQARIIDEIDLESDNVITMHFHAASWMDSNNLREE